MREAKENESIVAHDDVHAMLFDRIEALHEQTDGDARDKVMRKAQLALLGELLGDLKAVEKLKLPHTGRTIVSTAFA